MQLRSHIRKPEETLTPETPSTQVTDTPKNGDDTHMLHRILLAAAGMVGVVSAVWIARKKNKNQLVKRAFMDEKDS